MKMDAGKWSLAVMALCLALVAVVNLTFDPRLVNQGVLVVVACASLFIGLFAYVFSAPDVEAAPVKDRLAYLHERKEVIYENLRDLNFENKAGKFSPEDYQGLQSSLEEEAARALAEIAKLEKK
jgi:hypothetical protein